MEDGLMSCATHKLPSIAATHQGWGNLFCGTLMQTQLPGQWCISNTLNACVQWGHKQLTKQRTACTLPLLSIASPHTSDSVHRHSSALVSSWWADSNTWTTQRPRKSNYTELHIRRRWLAQELTHFPCILWILWAHKPS